MSFIKYQTKRYVKEVQIRKKSITKINFNQISIITGAEWSVESAQAVVELTQFRALQAQIAGYSESGLPEIYLYSYLSPTVSAKIFSSRKINEN